MKACNPPPPPPPLLEPGCGDPSIQGKIRCTIVQPNVNVDHMTYQSQVRFAPGDIVEVRADGCVQTGGHGSTWKRYVNPSGDGTDSKYHGLMKIPTAFPAGSGLIRIENFIGKLQVVKGDPNVPASDLFLELGYEDSDYGDNGYNDHDDGTNDQCSLSNIGYPASVTITIYRGVRPDPPQSRFDFDVLPTLVVHAIVTNNGVPNTDPDNLGMDHNGLLLNPTWSFHGHTDKNGKDNKGKDPSGDMCHDFSYRPSIIGIPTLQLEPYFADCTDQTDENNADMASGASSYLCYLGKHGPLETGSFPGHVNWFPVTMTGHAKWGNHEDLFPFGDDDYNFNFFPDSPDNSLLLAGRDALHGEFDSDETIDNFNSEAWNTLHDAVNNADAAKAALGICSQKHNCDAARIQQLNDTISRPGVFFDGTTVLTGMFGVDGEHDLKVELHPILALATQLDSQSDPLDEVWLMFARNRGDEGYCSSRLWDSGLEDYIVRLPWRDGATSVQVTQRDFHGPPGFTEPNFMIVPPGSSDDPGVYAIFHLGPAELKPFIDGSVHLSWTGAGSGVRFHPFPVTVTATTGTFTPAPAKPATASKGTTEKSNAEQSTASASAQEKSAATQAGTKAAATPKLNEVDEDEHVFQATTTGLTPAQLQEIQKARPPLVTRPSNKLPASKVETVSSVPINVHRVRLQTFNAGPATAKNERDAAGVKALCTATHNAPPGLPADVCSKAAPTQPPSRSPSQN